MGNLTLGVGEVVHKPVRVKYDKVSGCADREGNYRGTAGGTGGGGGKEGEREGRGVTFCVRLGDYS